MFSLPKPKPIPPLKPVTNLEVDNGFQKYKGSGDFLSTIFTSANGLKSRLKTTLGIGDKS